MPSDVKPASNQVAKKVTPPTATSRTSARGGTGQERPRLATRAWRTERNRKGLTWAQRKLRSQEYCPTTKQDR